MDRFRRLSGRDRRLAGTAAVLAAVLVIVAGVLVIPRSTQTPLPTTSPSAAAQASPSASASASAVIPPSASPSIGDAWSAYTDPPFQPSVSLTADTQDAAGVSATSTFTLATHAPVDAAGLARSIDITPSAPFDILPGASATSATIRPVGGLKAGQSYRFALHDTQGAELGSWAFAVKQPLHVASTLPDDRSTDVPVDTGIEITFDQDGATDVASHVTVDPPVGGTTETHGRTFVIVPGHLSERTLYTVTVRRGIAIDGSDQVLAKDVRFSFETGQADTSVPVALLDAERYVLEASPRERLVVAMTVDVADGATDITSLPVRVYRLESEARALAALRLITDSPNWARYTQIGQIDVAPLKRVASFSAPLTTFGDDTQSRWFRMPMALPAGWYVMDIARPDRHIQMFLQVTDIATYTAVTTDRTVVWVNDTATHKANVDARVSLASGGTLLGRTDARGLLIAPTPRVVAEAFDGTAAALATPILVVRASSGRSAFFALANTGSNDSHYLAGPYGGGASPSDRFVKLLYTDRYLYRQTDTVRVWGLLRERDRLVLPGPVEIRLVDESVGDAGPPLLTRPTTLTRSGSFALTLPIDGLPIGRYQVELWAGPIQVTVIEISVDVIRKPAYQIAVTTDKHAVIGGDSVVVSSHVTFYDGTAVPQTPIAIDGTGSETLPKGTTDQNGDAAVKVVLHGSQDGYDVAYLSVAPVGPEQGTIFGNSNVLVFPSSLWLDGTATVAGSRLTLAGSVHDVDFAGLERHAAEIATGMYTSDLDPRGTAVVGLSVDAVVSELVPVKTFDGRRYDFITKQVVDTYTYSVVVRRISTHHLVSGPDGRLRLSLTVAHPQHGFRITLTTRDSKSRPARLSIDAEAPLPASTVPDTRPVLVTTTASGPVSDILTQGQEQQSTCGQVGTSAAYTVGEKIRATMSDGRGPLPAGGSNQYLFVTAQRGLRDTTIQSSPHFSTTFTNADVPNLSMLGVRFDGTSYAPAEDTYRATFDPSARALSVHLSTDAVAYRPGGLVTLTVQTRDAKGKPVSATVTLRAVDEKLFTIGGAFEIDPLGDLYLAVGDGIVRATASREGLYPVSGDGCGSTGGDGGGRTDFVDSLLFRTVTTDSQGRAVISFHVSDDLTSWHVSASAVTTSYQAGESHILVPVGLPFFVETGLAPEYLVGDQPAVRVRAFGSSLKAGDPVTFIVSSSTLPMAARTVQGKAFEPIDVPLPPLTVGDQTLTVSASTGSGASARSDALTRHFTVIASRLTVTQTSFVALTAGASPRHGDSLTTYLFSDAGRGRFLPTLQSSAGSEGARLDQALARSIALDLEARYFGLTSGAPESFDPTRYQNGGMALLPYSGVDLELSADVALIAPGHVDRDALYNYFLDIAADDQSTRERLIIALAGRAGLGYPVLADVRAAAAATDLTATEQLYLGLAAAALGDDVTALQMESALLHALGQRQGPWVRLTDRSPDVSTHLSALLAMLAAETGDPVADAAMAYVSSHPATESVTSLIEMGYVQAGIRRSPAAAARFAYTVDGTRRVMDVAPGEAVGIALTASQAASLKLEPISGQVAIATSWQEPVTAATMPVDAAVTISREQSPDGAVASSGLVTVTLTLTFTGTLATDECYDVTDLAPSGLAPAARLQDWPQTDDNGDPIVTDVVDPYVIEGQRVRFCATPKTGTHVATLRYYLRVVTTGTYIWEPAVGQSSLAPAGAARTDQTTIVVH